MTGSVRALALGLALGAMALANAVPTQAAPGAEQPAAAAKPAQIDRNGVLILIRSTLLALDHANKTGNYTVLRDLGAPGFQVNTAARLAEIFADQRRNNLDLSGVAAIDPQLSLLPQIEANGFMRLAGFFPSIPRPVNFEMIFAPVDGQWRLFGLSISLGQSGAAAPPAPVAANPPPMPAAPAKNTATNRRAAPTPRPKPTPSAAAAPADSAR
ncbi:MAG: hypothetical protein R3D52_02445 [Xanthobacteraceae bacterium]